MGGFSPRKHALVDYMKGTLQMGFDEVLDKLIETLRHGPEYMFDLTDKSHIAPWTSSTVPLCP